MRPTNVTNATLSCQGDHDSQGSPQIETSTWPVRVLPVGQALAGIPYNTRDSPMRHDGCGMN
jgi:hypothetical protein